MAAERMSSSHHAGAMQRPVAAMTPHHHSKAHGHDAMIAKWIWRDYINITLGVWLMVSPITFAYDSAPMFWSDVISGALIVAFITAALSWRIDALRWGACAVGLWLLFAPLAFWAPQPDVYANDTLVGALVIAFSVLIPMMPGRAHHEVMMMRGPETPRGWSYNPSDWIQRGPIIAMAFVGFFISRYLAAYQLGHVPYPWDPFFGYGTQRVLDSDVSRAWPVSDAGLGATSYMLEALSGFMGGVTRWRTMPWMVLMFGILVIPLGVVSIVLVILQPVAVGAWCTLCLITAAAMLVMISPALDEVIAMVQFMTQARREGQSMWRTFWVGGSLHGDHAARHHPQGVMSADAPLWRQALGAMDLLHVPWNLAASALLGVWLMLSPSVFGTSGAPADSDHLTGALVVTFSVIAFGAVARSARWINVPLGLWLIAAPWLVGEFVVGAGVNDVAVGAALIVLAPRRGRIDERFAGWNRFIV
jgi:hypothetical protein